MELNNIQNRYLEICDAAYDSLQSIIQVSLNNEIQGQELYHSIIKEYKSSLNEEEFIVFKSKLFFPSNEDFLKKVHTDYYSSKFKNSKIYKDKFIQLTIEQQLFNLQNKIPNISDKYNQSISFEDFNKFTKNSIISNAYDLFLGTLIVYNSDKAIVKRAHGLSYDFYVFKDKMIEYHKFLYHTPQESALLTNNTFDQFVSNPFSNNYVNTKSSGSFIKFIKNKIELLEEEKKKLAENENIKFPKCLKFK